MSRSRVPPLVILLVVVLTDYAAQIPYYLVNYYLPHRAAPSISSIVLLGLTLLWFLVGYFGLRARKPFGLWVLLSFLLVEGLFYLRTMVFGVAAFQLANPSPVIRVVFIIGYVTGVVSLLYFAMILALRDRYLVTEDPRRDRART